MSSATVSDKRCVNCKKDVTGAKRMKDSSGQYWCIKCGQADQAKKGQSGVACGKCGDRYPADKLARYGAERICPGCYRRATKGGGVSLSAGGGDGSKKKLIGMLAVMGGLAAAVAWRYTHLH